MVELEIHCTLIDNSLVEFYPRRCTLAGAQKLFDRLGPHVKHDEETNIAHVDLTKRSTKTINQDGIGESR
jgi:hypothetical protein